MNSIKNARQLDRKNSWRLSGLRKQKPMAHRCSGSFASRFRTMFRGITLDRVYSRSVPSTSNRPIFEVSRKEYPSFAMRLAHEGATSISIEWNFVRNASSRETTEGTVISLIGKGHGKIYYRFHGIDETSEAKISEALLRPLLKFAQSR
jgi:hypothetical protein